MPNPVFSQKPEASILRAISYAASTGNCSDGRLAANVDGELKDVMVYVIPMDKVTPEFEEAYRKVAGDVLAYEQYEDPRDNKD
jgi:hypothetical protein